MAKTTELKKNSLQTRDVVKTTKTVIVSAIVYLVIWAIETYITKSALVEELKAAISVIVGMLVARFTDGNKVVVETNSQAESERVIQAVKREI